MASMKRGRGELQSMCEDFTFNVGFTSQIPGNFRLCSDHDHRRSYYHLSKPGVSSLSDFNAGCSFRDDQSHLHQYSGTVDWRQRLSRWQQAQTGLEFDPTSKQSGRAANSLKQSWILRLIEIHDCRWVSERRFIAFIGRQ